MNLYEYVKGRPTMLRDPSGKTTCHKPGKPDKTPNYIDYPDDLCSPADTGVDCNEAATPVPGEKGIWLTDNESSKKQLKGRIINNAVDKAKAVAWWWWTCFRDNKEVWIGAAGVVPHCNNQKECTVDVPPGSDGVILFGIAIRWLSCEQKLKEDGKCWIPRSRFIQMLCKKSGTFGGGKYQCEDRW